MPPLGLVSIENRTDRKSYYFVEYENNGKLKSIDNYQLAGYSWGI